MRVTNINEIYSKDWSPKLGSVGEIVENFEDIDQCIKIILTTPKGSVPHRPEFGSDLWQYIDRPINEAIPGIVKEIINSINTWEKRVEIRKITHETINENLVLYIDWVLKNTKSGSLTVVKY